jgi:hypothetical protein
VNSGVACYATVGSAGVGEWGVDLPVTVAAAALVTSPLVGEGAACIAQIRHTAPFLRLFVPNSLTVHPRSFFLKAVLAASFCPATYSNYSPAVTSSVHFLGLFVPNNSMVERRITFTLHIHSLLIHSWEAGVCTLRIPPLLEVSVFPF